MKVYAKIKTSQLIVKKIPYSDILNNFKTQDASYEAKTISCDFFYSVNGKIYKKSELPKGYDVNVDRQMSCLDIMLDDMEKLISACSEYEAEMPTEIKIIYDVNNNKLCANYQYDEIYSKTEKCADDMVEIWYQEICKSN